MDNLTSEFLARLWRGGAFGYAWTLPDHCSHWTRAARPKLPAFDGQRQFYFGIHPVDIIPPTNADGEVRAPAQVRGRVEFVSVVNTLFAEFDCARDAKPNLLGKLRAMRPTPSVIVDSGGGFHCVPLDTEILSSTGWKKYAKVEIGDTVLGYDTKTTSMKWTAVTGKIVKPNDPLVRIHNNHFSAVCTTEHRWVCDVTEGHGGCRTEKNKMVSAKDLSRRRHKIIHSAKFNDDSNASLPISDDEAAVLGWFASEGNMNIKNPNNFQVKIYQSAKKHALELSCLLSEFPHRAGAAHRDPGMVIFNISTPWFRELWNRVGMNGTIGKHEADWCSIVVRMSISQRERFLEAFFKGDGTYNRDCKVIIQNKGNIADGMKLAIFLSGHRPLTRPRGESIQIIRYGKDFTTWNLHQEEEGYGPVWCPQTKLGTWVMRQGETISITGNCYHLLDFPLFIHDECTRAAAARLQARWVDHLKSDPHSKDLARVLRVPGSLNLKYPDTPRVEFVTCELERTYRLDQLRAVLPAPKPATPHQQISAAFGSSEKLTAYLMRKALEHAGRNAGGLWLACQLRDNRYLQDEAERLMLEYRSRTAKKTHPYSEREALASLKQAYAKPARETLFKEEK